MNEFLKKRKNLVYVSVYALVLAVSSGLGFAALFGKIRSTADKIQEDFLDSEINRSKLQKLPQIEADWNDYEKNKDSIAVVLDRDSELGFIESLEAVASKTGNVISLQIGDEVKDKKTKLTYFPVRMNLKGSYADLFKFIHDCENMKYYMNIVSFDIKKESVEDKKDESARPDIFTPVSDKKKAESGSDKETLNSTLDVIVYSKSNK